MKVWDDVDDAEGIRPTELKVTLSNGTEVTLTAEDGWTATVSNLTKYDEDGEEIEYTWEEDTTNLPEGYTFNGSSKEGTLTTITNTYVPKTEATVKKIWKDNENQDGIRPVSLTVELSDGTQVILNADNEWTATIEELVKYNSDNKEIEYTWTEIDLPEGYTLKSTDKSGTITTLTNEHVPEVTSATVKKVWKDDENKDGIRPGKLTVTLSNGDEVILSEENSWTATIDNLPKYANGKEITYTWTEESVSGYELTTNVDGNITTLTNTHTSETISIKITKVWADDDNASGNRPESVTISLLADGVEYDKVILNEGNSWTTTIDNLPKYADGKEITYTVLEKEVPEGYEVAYEGDMETGFTIHNVLGQGDGEPPVNPQTGDNIILYLITLLISIVGIVSGNIYQKRFN